MLFPNAWDHAQFDQSRYEGEIEFRYLGDDLFHFPGNLQLVTFDAVKFVDRVCQKVRDEEIDGVLSSDEYIGAVIAAAATHKLGLPGTPPEQIITAQHKYYSRVAQREVLPEVTPPFTLIPLKGVADHPVDIEFPFFVKPVKGTFSLFAAKVDSREALTGHMGFNVFERLLLGRVTRPFNDLMRAFTDFEHDANHFIGEGLIAGDQVTVDGFVHDGQVTIMGITDSVMFPGTNIFERFEYPSRYEPEIQARMFDMTAEVMRGMGWTDGQFNVELFYERATDRMSVIEVNPRLSYQFADLFEYVDGSNSYDVLLDLALGREPRFRRNGGEFAYSASFVMRTFEGKKLKSVPTVEQVDEFGSRYDEATIKVYGKAGTSMKGEMKAIGSYRYAIINVAANSLLDLFAIHQDAIEKLPFEVA